MIAWWLAVALAQEPNPELEAIRAEIATQREQIEALSEENQELKSKLAELKDAEAPVAAGPLGDRVTYGRTLTIGPNEMVEVAVAYGGDLEVSGTVTRDATAFGGNIHVLKGGEVLGDVVAVGGQVVVDDGAQVHGDRIAMADGKREFAPGVRGLVNSLYHRFVFLLSFAGAGILVVGLVPQRVARIAESVRERPLRSFSFGSATSLGLVLVSALFVLTVIGIPISFLLIAVLGLAWLMGFVGLCQAIGDRLPFKQPHHGRWAAFLGGILFVTFVGVLPGGWLVATLGSMVGVGAAVRTRFGSV